MASERLTATKLWTGVAFVPFEPYLRAAAPGRCFSTNASTTNRLEAECLSSVLSLCGLVSSASASDHGGGGPGGSGVRYGAGSPAGTRVTVAASCPHAWQRKRALRILDPCFRLSPFGLFLDEDYSSQLPPGDSASEKFGLCLQLLTGGLCGLRLKDLRGSRVSAWSFQPRFFGQRPWSPVRARLAASPWVCYPRKTNGNYLIRP